MPSQVPPRTPRVNTVRNLVVLWLGRVVFLRGVHVLVHPAQQPAFTPGRARKAPRGRVAAGSAARRLKQVGHFREQESPNDSIIRKYDPFQGMNCFRPHKPALPRGSDSGNERRLVNLP